jgi:peptidoglycan/LPS O-acetylase OafA/YrhL
MASPIVRRPDGENGAVVTVSPSTTRTRAERGTRARAPSSAPMGYQPSLDGIRAIAVTAVLLYHADFRWIPGGFLGVDVFFVVSGYLITSLLLQEREGAMSNDLKQFWLRRAKRLLPALGAMLVVTCAYAALFVPDALYHLKRDVLAAATYSTNWWLIASHQSYFDALGRPPLLRHLWSLAVEEQWYLLWPLVFVGAMALVRGKAHKLVVPLVIAAIASSVWMAVLYDPASDASRVYFGTDTHISGLLLGAAAAMIWRPWRWPQAAGRHLVRLDALGWTALALLIVLMLRWGQDTTALYRGGFFLVAALSLVVITVSVHPGALSLRAVLSLPPLRWLGSRSYGLYLWHWPVFMVTRQQDYPWMDDRVRVALQFGVTLLLTELSFRLVETPIRSGSLMRRFRVWRAEGRFSGDRRPWATVGVVTALLGVGLVSSRIATAQPVDVATGGKQQTFHLEQAATPPTQQVAAPPAQQAAAPPAQQAAATAATLPPSLPRRVTVVGDSQANALVKNAPEGLASTLALTNGSIDGCGIADDGDVKTAAHFRRTLDNCQGWPDKWHASVQQAQAQVTLVVIGAWEVFDVDRQGNRVDFGTPTEDAYLTAQLQRGIDAITSAGSKVALLEIPCYAPVDGGGLTALPERGDRQRTGHLNDLMRQAAAKDPAHVTFITGPTQWCADPAIATDLAYRWDGVHYYRPGAKLVFDTITPELLAIKM